MVTSVGTAEFFQTLEEREAEEVRQATRVIKDACNRRMSGESCSSCPFYERSGSIKLSLNSEPTRKKEG